jgi:hypothetical protein
MIVEMGSSHLMKKHNKIKKVKKLKQQAEYTPVFINKEEENENKRSFLLQMIVKVFLVCVSASGLCVVLAQIYKIPASLPLIVFFCFISVIFFSLGFILFKKRVLVIPVLVLPYLIGLEEIANALTLFFNHMLYVLDGRLLSTAVYARYSWEALSNYSNSRSIASVFLVICILICFVFTVSSRGRFVGAMLITTVFTLTPAFGAEIAGYVLGTNILISGMFGVYAMWVAHAWENSGGVLHLNGIDMKKKNVKGDTKQIKKEYEPIYKITPGRQPYYHKYARNSIASALLAFSASLIAATAIPSAVEFDIMKAINSVKQVVELPEAVDRMLKHSFGQINDNGFFPEIGSGADISQGISINNPPTGDIPIIRITLDNDDEKIYLRGGIGIDFDSSNDEWSVVQDTFEYNRLLELMEEFTPESEYRDYWDLVQDSSAVDVMGRQDVKVDYLARTRFLLLPTQPFDDDFKTNSDYVWHKDTVIRPNKRVRSTTFDTIYPKLESFGDFERVYSQNIFETYDIVEYGYLTNLLGLSPPPLWRNLKVECLKHPLLRVKYSPSQSPLANSEVSDELKEYRELIHSIYTDVPKNEAQNMDWLLQDVYEATVEKQQGGVPDTWQPELSDLFYVQFINHYLRTHYQYSLTINNTRGENTTLGNFLFESRMGHCSMYASAMTLAVRHMGLPARYVTGIVTVADAGTEQEMAERDFHAWVEVYFDGIGWLPFDPTGGAHGLEGWFTGFPDDEVEEPAFGIPTQGETDDYFEPYEPTDYFEATPTHEVIPTPTEDEELPTSNDDDVIFVEEPPVDIEKIIMIIIIIMIPIAITVGVMLGLRSIKKAETLKLSRFKNECDNKNAGELYRFMFGLLSSEGVSAKTGETPLEFAQRTDDVLELEGVNSLKLSSIMPTFEKLEFSDFDLTHDEYNSLYEYVECLYKRAVTDKKPAERLIKRIKFSRY